jgi:fructose 1,6-bisphosphatase
MALNKSLPPKMLPADVKAALQTAVKRFNSQSKVAEELGVSTAVISTLLKDKYTGNVEGMEQRIRGQFMAETVRCPVMGTLSKRSCLDNQALPQAFTNPMRAALGRACKTCPNRKELT